ncbi:MAG: tRNA (N6-isopentenyl adenosine(37)-C2)-methylthiotransferase MiaB [Aggregatilineales bacterium]
MSRSYHIWTLGCQMNVADSQRLASELEKIGYQAADSPDNADVLVVNTCVVRQSAEDKAYGRLYRLRPIKEQYPDKVIGLMGCLVGVRDPLRLRKQLPFVDVFLPPSEPAPLIDFLHERGLDVIDKTAESEQRAYRDAFQDADGDAGELALVLPKRERNSLIAAYVPIVYGCSHACSFCIIPYRRGVERSRSIGDIVAEVRSLAQQGVREIMLLGQIVDRYGKDIPDGPDLADLLRIVHDAGAPEGLQRIRFLTSHPNWMTDKLLETVAELPHVMPHIEVPVQAGNDEVLQRMKRGYTRDDYRRLVARIREKIPNVAINTDVIVGFCGETDAQFQDTYDLLAELKLDKVHLAKYSPRPHTLSQRTMADDVPEEEKERRRLAIEDMQGGIIAALNQQWLGAIVPVLAEDRDEHTGKWRGRTPQNRLVHFSDERNRAGDVVDVEITWTGPWSMQGRLPGAVDVPMPDAAIPLVSNS